MQRIAAIPIFSGAPAGFSALSAAAIIITAALGAPLCEVHEARAQSAPVAPSAPSSPAENPLTTPHVPWNFQSDAAPGAMNPPGFTDPVVSQGVVYFGDDAGVLRALHADDGLHLWQTKMEKRILSVVTDDQRLYLTSEKGVAALQSINGTVAWNLSIPNGASEAGCALWPQTDSLFVGGSDGLVYALDRRTGAKIWTHDIVADAPPDQPDFPGKNARMSGIVVRPTGIVTDGKNVYQSIFDQSRLVALDCKTGRMQWSFQAHGWIYGGAALTDQFVFVGSQDEHFYCLKKEDGTHVWDIKTGSRIESAPVVLDKNVYIASCDGNMYCLDCATGKVVWQYQTERDAKGRAPIYSKPVILQDTLFFAAGEGQLYALATATGELRWKLRPYPGSDLYTSPATDGTRLFLTSRPSSDGPPPVGQSSVLAIGQ